MCLLRKPTAVFPAAWFEPPAQALAIDVSGVSSGTQPSRRRRRLWELNSSAACPILGVCLALPDQRQLMCKCGIDVHGRSDYELHQIGVSECRRRTPFAERVERRLDVNFASELRQVRQFDDPSDLLGYWQQAKKQPGWPGLMWALLTHPACGPSLEHEVLGDVHMMQHQVGMVTRVEQQRWDDLALEAERLQSENRQWQERWDEQQREGQRRQDAWKQEVAKLRQRIVQFEAARLQTQQRLADMTETLAGQDTLAALQREQQRLQEENQVLTRALKAATRPRAGPAKAPDAAAPHSAEEGVQSPLREGVERPAHLARQVGAAAPPKRVACVGGRMAQLPAYREVIQAHGLELLHHDGGDEDNIGQLPATLAAADLVICQVGCISHDAYWRVKDHCKRQGKPCVFLGSASRSALERAMTRIMVTWPSSAQAPT